MPYRMKNGKWRGTKMINGIVKTKSFDTKTEAKKWEASQNEEDWIEHSKTPSACFHQVATDYLDNAQGRFAHDTFNEKRLALRRFFQHAPADIAPENISPAICLKSLRETAKTVSGNSANRDRKNLAALWEWGKKYAGLPTLNPFREVEKFPFDEKPRYVPPIEDFWKAYAAAQEHDQTFLLFMLHTGARMGEVYRLKWDDVDLQARKVRLGTRKNALGGMKYEWLPMTTKLYHALGLHNLHVQSEYVFTDPATGKPYSARGHFMKRLCNRAKVRMFGFHAIRHLTATILAYEGLSIPEVQAILRHSNPNTTARYIKRLGVQANNLDRVFDKIETPKVIPFEVYKKAICT